MKWVMTVLLVGAMCYNGFGANRSKGADKLGPVDFDWVRSNCQPEVVWCLDTQNYIKFNMYVAGLQNEYERCDKR
jgi:hypothetical protein